MKLNKEYLNSYENNKSDLISSQEIINILNQQVFPQKYNSHRMAVRPKLFTKKSQKGIKIG